MRWITLAILLALLLVGETVAVIYSSDVTFARNVSFQGPISISSRNPISSGIAAGSFINASLGLKNTSNKIGLNLSSSSGLELGTGSAAGALKIDPSDASLSLASSGVSVRSGLIKRTLAAGTGAGANVTVSGMAVGDELISVTAYTTAASIASMADRTSEYVIATGHLYKVAGTNSTGNQLDILWLDRTA